MEELQRVLRDILQDETTATLFELTGEFRFLWYRRPYSVKIIATRTGPDMIGKLKLVVDGLSGHFTFKDKVIGGNETSGNIYKNTAMEITFGDEEI